MESYPEKTDAHLDAKSAPTTGASANLDDYRIAAKEAELTKKFKINFSASGEAVEGQISFDDHGLVQHGAMIYARPPKLSELNALQDVLERGRPSQLLPSNNHTGIKFYFLERPLKKDGDDAVATHVNRDKTGRPAIYMGAEGVTDAHVVLHELGHNTQTRLDWRDQKRFLKYSHELGFAPFVSPGGESIFALRDKAGGLHRVDPENLDWLSIDDQGRYLDKDGKPCQGNQAGLASRLDAGQMRQAAAVKPATSYYSNPLEMSAEALALYRESPSDRLQLLKETPILYRFTKGQDQKDINQAYGLDPSGRPLYLRLPDGHLATNTRAHRDEIEKFEK